MIAGQEAHTTLLEALLTAVTELGEEGGGDGLAEAPRQDRGQSRRAG